MLTALVAALGPCRADEFYVLCVFEVIGPSIFITLYITKTYDFGRLSSSAEFCPGLSQTVPDCPVLTRPDREEEEGIEPQRSPGFAKATPGQAKNTKRKKKSGFFTLVKFVIRHSRSPAPY